MSTTTLMVSLSPVECATCGVVFGLSQLMSDKRREDHARFYCPNGHIQYFPAETEAEKLRRQLKAQQDYSDSLNRRLTNEQNSHRATKGVVTKMRKRAIVGTCQFCHRHFTNMERHVATKHPQETPDE